MQELEKILEEIQKAFEENTEDIVDEDGCHHFAVDGCTATYLVNKIIRKHMNDGWIPVDERLPKAGEHVLVSFRSAGFLPATAIISENGRWSMLQGAKGFNDVTEDVIAWRPLPEPYRSANKTEASDWRKDMLRKFDRRD